MDTAGVIAETVNKQVDTRASVDVNQALKLRLKHNLPYRDIAERLGCSKSAVHKALKPFLNLLTRPDAVEAFKSQEAEFIDAARLKILRNLVDNDRLKKASVNNLAYAFSNLYNAQRLERGESTANVAYAEIDGSLEELQERKEALRAELGEK